MSRRQNYLPIVTPLEPRVLLAAALVHDFTPGGIEPMNLAVSGERVFFSGITPAAGRELWTSDGTVAGTRIVTDLRKGTSNSDPTKLVGAGALLFFAARSSKGWGVYRSDGTAAGTFRVLALNAARDFANPTALGGLLLFQMPDANGYSLWKSDGTASGTVKVAANLTGSPFISIAADAFMIGLDTQGARPTLIVSDGTTGGTHVIDYQGETVVGSVSTLGEDGYFASGTTGNITLYHVNRAGDVAPVIDPHVRMVDPDAPPGTPATYGPAPLTAVSIIPAAERPGERPYAIRLDVYAEVETRLYLLQGTKPLEIDSADLTTGFLPPDSSIVVTPRNDYIIAGNETYALQVWRIDTRLLQITPSHSFDFDDRFFMDRVETIVNGYRVGNSFFAVMDTADERHFVEMNLSSGIASPMKSIPKPGNMLTDLPVASSSGLFFPGTDGTGVRELYFRAPGGESVNLTNLIGGPASSHLIAQVWTDSGRLVARRTKANSAAIVLDLITSPESSQRITSYGTTALRAVDVELLASDDRVFALVTFENKSGARSMTLYARFLSTGKTSQCAVPLNTRLIGVRNTSPLLVFNDPQAPAERVLGTWAITSTDSTLRLIKYGPAPSSIDVAGREENFQVVHPGSRLYFASGSDVLVSSTFGGIGLSIKGSLQLQSTVHSLTLAGGTMYAANAEGIYRHDYDNRVLTDWLRAGELGSGMTVRGVVGGDDEWLHVVVADSQQRWQLLRVSSTDPANRRVIAVQNAEWLAEGFGVPRLWATRGTDAVLVADGPLGPSAIAVRNDVLDLRSRVDSLVSPELRQDDRNIVIRADASRIVLLRNANWFALATPGDLASMTLEPQGLTFIGSTDAAGRELFGYRLDTTVSGNLYNDLDADLSRDDNERGLRGWRVYVDRNDNGRFDRNEPNTLTDNVGNFEFFELDPGTYKLRISTGVNYQMTTGTAYTVKLLAGTNVRKKFGARAIV